MSEIRNVKQFRKLKKKYTGFYVDVKMKRGNGPDAKGIIAPLEIELEVLSYLGLNGMDGNYLLILNEDNSCSYICATVIKSITVDTSKECQILPRN